MTRPTKRKRETECLKPHHSPDGLAWWYCDGACIAFYTTIGVTRFRIPKAYLAKHMHVNRIAKKRGNP